MIKEFKAGFLRLEQRRKFDLMGYTHIPGSNVTNDEWSSREGSKLPNPFTME
ncbi:hypothetical protein KHA80_21270 [Anaerobacillus sp. HL2]|nr:hypothetical protein KHA80_21270 [Anaerobacillus sp. HL2]